MVWVPHEPWVSNGGWKGAVRCSATGPPHCGRVETLAAGISMGHPSPVAAAGPTDGARSGPCPAQPGNVARCEHVTPPPSSLTVESCCNPCVGSNGLTWRDTYAT